MRRARRAPESGEFTPTPRSVNVRLFAVAALALAAALPVRADAQSTAPVQDAGPTVTAARAGIQSLTIDAGTPPAFESMRRMTRSETLMIVGGAIFLAGAIIGDDAGTIIMISGAAIGIWGLYQYLQ